jgi:hypothetical protein
MKVLANWYIAETLLNHPYVSILAMFFMTQESIQAIDIATICPLVKLMLLLDAIWSMDANI